MVSIVWVFLAATCSAVSAGIPVTEAVRTFGHSIKNGRLPPNTELPTFAHSCSKPPCVVTQIHLPSIYANGETSAWQDGRFRLYVDGESVASFDLLFREIAFLGHRSVNGTEKPSDGSPWGTSLFGHTAKNGGVYSTVRVPFLRTLRATVTAPPRARHTSTFWMVIRGLEATPVTLGEFVLPEAAKLHVARTERDLSDMELVTIANASRGGGALLLTKLDADAPNYQYLEGCLRLMADDSTKPLFLSSGAEDYFLSSSYFDEGMFKTEESGLTYFDGKGSLSAYKTHVRDPVIWRNSMQLVWRCGEATSGCGSMTHCPDRFCPDGGEDQEPQGAGTSSPRLGTPAHYSTLVMFYTWPALTAGPPAASIAGALSRLGLLGLPQDVFDAAAERVLAGDSKLTGILAASLEVEDARRLIVKMSGATRAQQRSSNAFVRATV